MEAPIEVPRLRDITQMFVLHGSIGAGKSTLLREMQHWARLHGADALDPEATAEDRFLFIGEPVVDWDEKRYAPVAQCSHPLCESPLPGRELESLLGKYYAQPRRYSFLFQMNAFVTRLCDLARQLSLLPPLPPPQPSVHSVRYHIVCEGGMSRDWLFASMLRQDGTMEPAEWDTYERNFTATVGPVHARETALLYVPTQPIKCKERQLKRGRESERNIPLDYLEKLEAAHLQMLDEFPGHVLRLEAFEHDLSASELQHEVSVVMHQLLNLCHTV